MNFSKKTLDKFLEDSTLNNCNIYSYFMEPLKILRGANNQKEFILLEDINPDSDLEYLRDFGIGCSRVGLIKKYYVLFVNPDDIRGSLVNFYNQAPDEVTPTHLCVISNDIEVIKSVTEKIKEEYPSIQPTQYMTEQSKDALLDSMIEELGIPSRNSVFVVDEYVERIKSKGSTVDAILEYSKCAEEIKNVSKNKLLLYTGNYENFNIYARLGLVYYLNYGKKFYVNLGRVNYVCRLLTNAIMNKDTMLIEELVSSFKNLPDILIELVYKNLMYNIVKSKSLILSVSSIELSDNEKDNIRNNEILKTEDINILSLYDLYDLDSVEGCKLMKDKIMSLYKLLDIPKDKIISVTDLILFQMPNEDTVRLGVVKESKFIVNVETIHRYLGRTSRTIGYEELQNCYPPDIMIDGLLTCRALFKPRLENYSDSMCKLKYKPRKYSIEMLDSRIKFNSPNFDKIPLSTVGLFSIYDSLFRESINKDLANGIGVNKAREKVDCFGGFTPILTPVVTI